jgi:hypothetical protein
MARFGFGPKAHISLAYGRGLKTSEIPFLIVIFGPKLPRASPFGMGHSRERIPKSHVETQMSETVAHTLVDVLERSASLTYSA